MLPVIDKVKLLTINDRGVLLSGIEIFPARGAKGNGPIEQSDLAAASSSASTAFFSIAMSAPAVS